MMVFNNTGLTFIIYLFIVIGLLTLSVSQFIRIRRIERLFKVLSDRFDKDKTLGNASLVEKIIRSADLYVPGPSVEVIDMIAKYIKQIINDSKVFIHVTSEKSIAENILKEGFKYSEDFYKSSQEISSDLSDLTYKLQIYRPYGKYIVILCIAKDLYKSMSDGLYTGTKDLLTEYGISEYNPENELSYKLPAQFVSGYVDVEKRVIVENKFFKTR